jgi:hypothetical protein
MSDKKEDIDKIKDLDKTVDLDNMENYLQNSIAAAANIGTFSQAPLSVTELTQINPNGIEINDNDSEKKEKIEKLHSNK